MQNEADFDLPVVDNCCEKETYAFAGLAFYWASVLEHGALNLAVVLALPDVGALTREQFDETFESLSRRTLGQLLNAAKTQISISQETKTVIEDAVIARNLLIHRFFRDHAEDFISENGKAAMKNECLSLIKKFKAADFAIERIYMPLWEKYGVDDNFVEDQMAQMEEQARKRDAF